MKELHLLISGCGRMGQMVAKRCEETQDMRVLCGVDPFLPQGLSFSVLPGFSAVSQTPDVLIDFSSPKLLDGLLEYALAKKVPCVICTTGYSDAQLTRITNAACKIPIFRSANMSVGIWLLAKLARETAAMLGEDFDIELVEKHHNRKVDAPSGTALALVEAVQQGLDKPYAVVCDRTTRRQPRDKQEIGVSCVRGGTIVGDHELIFAGTDEVITLEHNAASPMIFATGAVRAARFLANCPPGLYGMDQLMQATCPQTSAQG